jgi:hypothetical protein
MKSLDKQGWVKVKFHPFSIAGRNLLNFIKYHIKIAIRREYLWQPM